MSATNQLVDDLLSHVEDTVNGFNESIPDIEKQIYNRLVALLKDLDIKNGIIKNTVANLKAISRMKSDIEKIVFSPKYQANVTDFLKAYSVVSDLNNKYFEALVEDFKPGPLLAKIKRSAIDITADGLTEAGINANVIDPVRKMLLTAVTTGGSYADLIDTLRTNIVSEGKNLGTLQRYTRQITTDSINQFSASYNNAIASGLNLRWYMYVGSNLTTTRPFCKHLSAKKYIHEQELPMILKGDIDGYHVPFNVKTGIWYGGIPGTNESNFPVYRGGYNCGHQLYPVNEISVPKAVRIETYSRLGIEFDKDGMAKAA